MLEVSNSPHWGEHVSLDAGAGTWWVDQGLFFPVLADGEPVGFVLIGPGHAEVPLARTEAWWASATLGVDIGPRWEVPFDRAVSFGVRDQDAQLWTLPKADVRRGAVTYRGKDGRENVVVTGFDYGGAYGEAQTALRNRVSALDRAGVDPVVMHTLEKVDPIGRWLGEVHADGPLTALIEPAAGPVRWLSFSIDPAGLVDPERAAISFVHGVSRLDTTRWTTLSGLGEPTPVRITEGVANVVLVEGFSGRDAKVEVRTVLTVHGGSSKVLPIEVPYHAPIVESGSVVTARAYDPEPVSIDGVPLVRVADGYGPYHLPNRETGLYLLPESGPARVSLAWRDRWPTSHTVNLWEWAAYQWDNRDLRGPEEQPLDYAKIPEWVELGARAIDRPVWPRTGPFAPPYPAELRVGTGVGRWSVWGPAPETRPDGARWWRVDGTDRNTVSFGVGAVDVYAAARGFPEVRVERGLDGDQWPRLVRAVLNFYADGMPQFPHPSIDVVMDVDRLIFGIATPGDPAASVRHLPPEVSAGPGRVVVHGRRFVPVPGTSGAGANSFSRSAVERGMAEALARQWFDGHRPRDQWIEEAMAVYLRDRYVYEAFGDKGLAQWRDRDALVQEDDPNWLRSAPWSLVVRQEPWAGEIGGRLLLDYVEPRIGERALFEGVRAYLAGTDRSTASFVGALSTASRTPLQGFFDTFVVAGLRPELDGRVERTEEGLVLRITADPPVGSYEVPVLLSSGRVERVEWVLVSDGEGSREVPFPGVVREIVLDPRDVLGQRQTLDVQNDPRRT